MHLTKLASALLFVVVYMSAQSAARPGCVNAHSGNPDDVSIGASSASLKLPRLDVTDTNPVCRISQCVPVSTQVRVCWPYRW